MQKEIQQDFKKRELKNIQIDLDYEYIPGYKILTSQYISINR